MSKISKSDVFFCLKKLNKQIEKLQKRKENYDIKFKLYVYVIKNCWVKQYRNLKELGLYSRAKIVAWETFYRCRLSFLEFCFTAALLRSFKGI